MILSGGTCALLMQLAHPAVAAGVAQHSDFREDPFARLRRTLAATHEVVFGPTKRAERALRRINLIHGAVRGVVPESGDPYHALDPRLLFWAHATLVDTAVRVFDTFVAPLTEADAQAYHAEATQVAVRLGIPEGMLPATLVELRAEMQQMIRTGEVAVTPTALELSRTVLYPTGFPPRPAWDVAHLISLSVLTPELRRGYRIGWSAARQRGILRLATATRRFLPLVPAPLRHVPAARSAERRLRRAAQGSDSAASAGYDPAANQRA